MADFDPFLDLLPRAPLTGLDVNAVQKERQHYWERLYEKYERSSELDQEEISVNDLDNPATLKRLPGLRCELPTTKAFRRYIAQQGGLLDELTTIAGPPALDEEELSSEDDGSNDEEGDDLKSVGDDEEGVDVGLGDLDMRQRDSDEHRILKQMRSGGRRSGEEYVMSGEAEETEEEEDFSSPPAKIVTPSRRTRRVVVEYHTSEDEEEEQSPRVTAAETRRGDDDDGEEENLLTCINCGALGDILEEGGDKFQFRCDDCLMKVHLECEDLDCSVCRETAAVVEARWILRCQLAPLSGDSGEEEWATGVEGDAVTQSSDGTDQDSDRYEEEDAQYSSGVTGGAECDTTGEGEMCEDSYGADTSGDVYEEDSKDYTSDGDQEGDSNLEECDSSRDGQAMDERYKGNSFGFSGMEDSHRLQEGELHQDSMGKMENEGTYPGHFNVEERSREMSWEGEDSTEEEDNLSAVSMSTVF